MCFPHMFSSMGQSARDERSDTRVSYKHNSRSKSKEARGDTSSMGLCLSWTCSSPLIFSSGDRSPMFCQAILTLRRFFSAARSLSELVPPFWTICTLNLRIA